MMRALPWIVVLVLGACASESRRSAPAPEPAPAAAAPRATLTPPGPPLDDGSIYELDLPLRDQTGATIDLAVHRGHPVLIAMFYGSCGVACPRLIEDVRQIVAAIPAERRDATRVLLVSFDPARDDPAALARLGAERGLDPARWTLAVARADDARLLAAVLGVRYRQLPNGEFVHSSVITVLDADGHAVARLDGMGGDTEALAARVP